MKFRRAFLLMAALLLVIGAALPTAGQDTKAVTIVYDQELDNLNPMYSSMFFMGITQSLYLAPAWNFDPDLNPVPVLVTEIPSSENGGLSEDGTTITLNLRDDIVWSDGEPITSADFIFTYDMFMAEGNLVNSRYPYEEIASIEAPDETTVVVTFDEPFAPWLATLFGEVLPEHVLAPVFEAEGTLDTAEWNRAPTVSSGPFVFAEWEIGSFMRFNRNENFYDGAPILDAVLIRFVPDSETLLATLLNGEADMATFISYADVPALEEAGFTPQIVNSGYNEQWFLNLREGLGHPSLTDPLVREALVLAFDRFSITEDLLNDLTYPADSYWEGSPYDNPETEAPPYDPERAAELLDEAGWVDSDGDGIRDQEIDGELVPLNLRYITNTRQIRVDVQAVVQQAFAELGIGIELINYPSDVFFNGYAQGGPAAIGDFDIAQWSQTGSFPDPNTTVFLCDQIPTDESPDGNNYRGYCNPEVDALFEEANRTTDTQARIDLFHQIDRILTDEFIFIGVWYDPDLWVVSGDALNVAVNGATPYWNAAEWDVFE